MQKLQDTGHELMKWHKTEFDNQKVELRIIQEKLNDLMRLPYSSEQYEEQRVLHVKQSQLLAQQEKYWRQRSRAIWLKDGDRNSAYFHRRASNRRSKNLIRGLTDECNQWQTEPKEIQRLLLSYFSQVFSTEGCDMDVITQILEATPVKVTPEMNENLLKPYTEEEIKGALFQMHPSKSPGPDGMSPFFFQKYWNTVGQDVCSAVRSFLETAESCDNINFTYLCLIPKIKDPLEAAQFRPIALSNIICRIASKVVANRLKLWLPHIISPHQSAYVPGRIISDNTLVANEVAHFIHKLRHQEDGFFSLKLDISKAYDRLEWPYLQAILTKLGFHPSWICMVMHNVDAQCILKLNVDASHLPNLNRGGVGGVLRTSTGQVIAAFAGPIPHTASPKQSEMYAIRAGLNLVNTLRKQAVILESDCTEAIAEVSCVDHSLLANGGLIADIKQAMASISQVQLCYTPRSCNLVAHRLAGIGFEASHHFVWLDHTPEGIQDVINYDCNHLT